MSRNFILLDKPHFNVFRIFILMRGRAVVARRAHNLEVLGSNPSPATKKKVTHTSGLFWFERFRRAPLLE